MRNVTLILYYLTEYRSFPGRSDRRTKIFGLGIMEPCLAIAPRCKGITRWERQCETTKNLNSLGLCTSCCPVCRMMDQTALASCNDSRWDCKRDYMDKWRDHAIAEHGFPPPPVQTHKGNGAYLGQWAFTLTKSPKDDLTEEDMIKAARKLMAQQSCPVKYFAWYLEHKEGKKHPHIHGMYECEGGGRIEKKHFVRAWPIWGESKDNKNKMGAGFRGGYHRPVKNEEGYLKYISEDDGVHDSCLPPDFKIE